MRWERARSSFTAVKIQTGRLHIVQDAKGSCAGKRFSSIFEPLYMHQSVLIPLHQGAQWLNENVSNRPISKIWFDSSNAVLLAQVATQPRSLTAVLFVFPSAWRVRIARR